MDFGHNLLSFLIAIAILVGFHEWGHFWTARRLGIRVLNFSIGFGPKLFGWQDGQGCQYQIALIPLGGYVRMLDESEGPLPPSLKSQSFEGQPIWKRMAVVVAGPVANLLLAVLIYAGLYMWGVERSIPRMDTPVAGSIAERAGFKSGMQLLAIGSQSVQDWEQALYALSASIGERGHLPVTVSHEGATQQLELALLDWQMDESRPDLLGSLGIRVAQPPLQPILGKLMADGVAAQSGLQTGDRILSLAGQPIASWQQLVRQIQARPSERVELVFEREGRQQEMSLTLGERLVAGHPQGFIGAGVSQQPLPAGWTHLYQLNPLAAVAEGIEQTGRLLTLSAQMLGKLVSGQLSLRSLSGPVSIAEGAGQSAHYGLVYYLGFIAFISINIGFLNLLPIPVLDGGLLLLLAIEGVRRRPLSDKLVAALRQGGWLLVMGLTLLALTNDLTRLFG